jgi:hypothetical protein
MSGFESAVGAVKPLPTVIKVIMRQRIYFDDLKPIALFHLWQLIYGSVMVNVPTIPVAAWPGTTHTNV